MKIDLSGKLALVTGGGRGLGREISLALAEAGADVILTWVNNPEAAIDTANEIEGVASELNVTNEVEIVRLRDTLQSLDILVNNAGVNQPANFLQIPFTHWEEVLAVNLTGVWLVTKYLWELLGSGASIINIGSSSAATGGPTSTHYAASKAGLEALTRNVALYGADRGIRCNCVAPGYLQSPMAQAGMEDEKVKETVNGIPLGRLGTFREVADVVTFLASDKASYITGQVVRVDGGLVFGS